MILLTGDKGFIGNYFKEYDYGIDLKDGKNLLTCDLPKDVDTVIHLAAQTSVDASWTDPVHDSDNLKMIVRLIHNYPNCRLIYANSAASIDPQSPYGFSKWACAEYLKKFHKNYVICTLPNVYGEGSHSVVDIFNKRETVTIFGDGKQTRDYVHVKDIVKGLSMAIDWPIGEYQLGSGIATSVLEIAKGKKIIFDRARKEARESVLQNTTPNWKPTIFL